MVPADSHRVPRAPRYLGATRKEDCIFRSGTVPLCGRPFQAVLLTLPYPFFRTRPISETPAFQPAPVRTNEPNLIHPVGDRCRKPLLFFVVLQPRAFLSNRPV